MNRKRLLRQTDDVEDAGRDRSRRGLVAAAGIASLIMASAGCASHSQAPLVSLPMSAATPVPSPTTAVQPRPVLPSAQPTAVEDTQLRSALFHLVEVTQTLSSSVGYRTPAQSVSDAVLQARNAAAAARKAATSHLCETARTSAAAAAAASGDAVAAAEAFHNAAAVVGAQSAAVDAARQGVLAVVARLNASRSAVPLVDVNAAVAGAAAKQKDAMAKLATVQAHVSQQVAAGAGIAAGASSAATRACG